MVFVSGPRQCGKTTLALEIIKQNEERYFNWDSTGGREMILKGECPSARGIIVLDEIHKFKQWRNYLKGLYSPALKYLKNIYPEVPSVQVFF